MKIDNTHKIKKTIVFLKNKILYCQANGLRPYYFQQQLEVETNKWFKQRSEEFKQQEQ
jgi:hypothetical protein